MNEPNYVCQTCNTDLYIPIDNLQEENDVIRIHCDGCKKTFIMGITRDESDNVITVTYQQYDSRSILHFLEKMIEGLLPVGIVNEVYKLVELRRWLHFRHLINRYRTIIASNQQLITFLTENMLL